jgi:hypothetical protein
MKNILHLPEEGEVLFDRSKCSCSCSKESEIDWRTLFKVEVVPPSVLDETVRYIHENPHSLLVLPGNHNLFGGDAYEKIACRLRAEEYHGNIIVRSASYPTGRFFQIKQSLSIPFWIPQSQGYDVLVRICEKLTKDHSKVVTRKV